METPIINSIKIGRKEFKIQKGDYILFNQSSHQFCSGDGRILFQKKFDSYTYIRIPKTTVKSIPLDKLEKVESVSMGANITKYFF